MCATPAFVFVIFFSCNGNGKGVQDVDVLHMQDSIESANDTLELIADDGKLPESVDELFDDFFFTFVTNQGFQMQRIAFPLPYSDGEVAKTISRSEWNKHNRFIFQEVFSIIFEDDDDMSVKNDTSISRVSIQWIDFNTDSAEIYTFRKGQSRWVLRSINKTDTDDLPNSIFLKFLSRFVCDSIFQAESIEQPLRMITSDDTEDENTTDILLDADEWDDIRHQFPLPHTEFVCIDYGQPSSGIRHKQVLMLGMSNNLYVKFKFHRYRAEWKLIEIEG